MYQAAEWGTVFISCCWWQITMNNMNSCPYFSKNSVKFISLDWVKVLAGLVPSGNSWGESVSLPFAASRVWLQSLGQSPLHPSAKTESEPRPPLWPLLPPSQPLPLTLTLPSPSSKDTCDYTGLTWVVQVPLSSSRFLTWVRLQIVFGK